MEAHYSKATSGKVKKAMHEMKAGILRSGRSGAKVKSRKQAIAIGLSEARAEGKKMPKHKKAVSVLSYKFAEHRERRCAPATRRATRGQGH